MKLYGPETPKFGRGEFIVEQRGGQLVITGWSRVQAPYAGMTLFSNGGKTQTQYKVGTQNGQFVLTAAAKAPITQHPRRPFLFTLDTVKIAQKPFRNLVVTPSPSTRRLSTSRTTGKRTFLFNLDVSKLAQNSFRKLVVHKPPSQTPKHMFISVTPSPSTGNHTLLKQHHRYA